MNNLTNIDLIKELELEKWPENKQLEFFEKVEEILILGAMSTVYEMISEEDKKNLNKMIEEDADLGEIVSTIYDLVPEFDTIFNHEVDRFKRENKEFLDNIDIDGMLENEA